MSVSQAVPRPGRRLYLIAIASVVVSACGEPPPTGPEDPRVEPAVEALTVDADQRLVSVGIPSTIPVLAVDGAGNPVDVELDWAVADPAVATVSETGEVTALSVGATDVTATLPADRHAGSDDLTASVRVTTVQTAPGVVIVSAAAVASEPEIVSARDVDPLTGVVARFTLSDDAPSLEVGDRLIISDWSFFGDVEAVTPSGSDRTITVASSALDGFFEEARLRYEASIDDFAFLEDGVASAGPSRVSPFGAVGPTLSPDVAEELFDDLLSDLDHELGKFKCSTTVDGSLVSLNPQLEYDVDFQDLDFVFDQTVASGIGQDARFYVQVDYRTEVHGTLEWEESMTGRVECLAPVKTPFVQEGPFVIAIPTGVGFALQATASSTDGLVTVDGHIDSTHRLGLRFSLAELVTPINESTHDLDDLDIDIAFPSLTDPDAARGAVNLDFFGFNALHGGVGFGVKAGLYKKMDMLYLGVRLRTDVAGVERQLRDDSYAAQTALAAFAKRTPTDPLLLFRVQVALLGFTTILELVDTLGIADLQALFEWDLELPLATTPTGTLVASPLQVETGTPVTFALDLESETFLGGYQVGSVSFYRLRGTGLSTESELVGVLTPQPGQKHFEWSWTPSGEDADDGFARFAAVIESVYFSVAVFQMDLPLEIGVVEAPPEWGIADRSWVTASGRIYWDRVSIGNARQDGFTAEGPAAPSIQLTGVRPPDAPANCSPVTETAIQADVDATPTRSISGSTASYDLISTHRIRATRSNCDPAYSVGAQLSATVEMVADGREIEWTLTVELEGEGAQGDVIIVNTSAGSELEVRPGQPLSVSGSGTRASFAFIYQLYRGVFATERDLDATSTVTVSLTATVVD